MANDTIEIDISKATLYVHRLSDGASARFENTKSGFLTLRNWPNNHDVARIVYEPTGPYHRAFEVAMTTHFPLVKVNPLQARRFAKHMVSVPKQTKSMRECWRLRGRHFRWSHRQLRQIYSAISKNYMCTTGYDQRSNSRSQSSENADAACPETSRKKRITQLHHQLCQVNETINELLRSTPETSLAFDIICSIPGLLKVSAAALLIEMPELGTPKEKQVASLAGLAPMTRQSGRWSGKVSYKAAANTYGMHFICLLSLLHDTIQIRSGFMSASSKRESPQKLPFQLLCVS